MGQFWANELAKRDETMVTNDELRDIIRAQQLGIFESDSTATLLRNCNDARNALEEYESKKN